MEKWNKMAVLIVAVGIALFQKFKKMEQSLVTKRLYSLWL